MPDGEVEVRANNTNTIKSAMNTQILIALEEIGLLCEGYAKKLCPVDTGRLRNSITHAISNNENAVYVGTNTSYAGYVELGTARQKAQPYLRPAATQHKSQYERILKSKLGGS